MKCLNVIVCYENHNEVKEYIEEVASLSGGEADIALVINSDKNSKIESVVAELQADDKSFIHIIDYGENVGYLNAMLKTIRRVDINSYDYIILSNTDIHYEENFFRRLEKKDYPKEVGCIAPCVYNPKSGSYSNPHYLSRVPKEKLKRLMKIYRHPTFGRCYLKLGGIKSRMSKKEKRPSCYVYCPHGCYMIFTREFIKNILGYEYGAILYSEEGAIGELLIKYGFKCFYDETLSVVHFGESVTGKIHSKERFSAWSKSLEYVLEEFY